MFVVSGEPRTLFAQKNFFFQFLASDHETHQTPYLSDKQVAP